MDHQGGEQHENQPGSPERVVIPPRVYVASLSDYNDGRLHGAWIDAAVDDDELHERVQTMLAASPLPGAEEWAIHDFEGFAGLELHEYESLETVATIARGIAAHGAAFAAFVRLVGTSEAGDERRFEDMFLGHYESMADVAQQLADDLGLEAKLDRLADGLRPYVVVDYDALGRDLGTELGEEPAPDGGIFVFNLHV